MNAVFSAFFVLRAAEGPSRRPIGVASVILGVWMFAGWTAAVGQDDACIENHLAASPHETLSDADVEHVRLELAIDPARPPARGRAIVTLRTTTVEADSVRLVASGVEVTEVISDDIGEELPFRRLGPDTLLIDLRAVRDSLLVAREAITLDIGLEAVDGLRFDGTYVSTIDPVHLGGAWFPWSGDPNDRFTSELHVTAPAEHVVVATGSALARGETHDGRLTHLFSSVEAHQAGELLIAAGPFVRARSGFRVESLHAPSVSVSPGVIARRALEYFESELEYPYPFGVLTLVVIPGIDAPVSRRGIILVPSRLVDVPSSHLPRYSQLELVEAVARQWFGSVVWPASAGDAWLESGVSAYLAAIFAESEIGTGAFEVLMRRLADAYFDENGSHDDSPASMDAFLRQGKVQEIRAKGAWAAHSLRQRIGDNSFWEALAAIVSENAFAAIEPNDLAAAVEAVSDERVTDFLRDWMLSEGHPELAASYSTGRDTLFITIEQRQLGDDVPEVYDLSPTIEIGALSGPLLREVQFDELRETFAFPFSGDPRFVAVDADMRYLMQVHMEQSLSAWIAQLRGATTTGGRLAATRAIAQRRGHPDVLIGLRSALAGESNTYVKAAIVDLIRQLSASEAAERALLSAFEDTSAVVRSAALRALSAYTESANIEQLALEAANDDPSERVQAAAVETLSHIGSDQALDVARAALITPSHGDVIRRSGLRAFASIRNGGAVALDAASMYSKADHSVAVRLEAIRLLEQLAKSARRAENELLDLLASGDHRIRFAAAVSLLRLGNQAAIRSFAEGEPLLHVRRHVAALMACQ